MKGFVKNVITKCKKIYAVIRSNFLRLSLYLSFSYLVFLIFNSLDNSPPIKHIPSVKLGQQTYLSSPKNVPIERTIDIVMGADDGFIQHSAATIASILLNCDASSYFRFHILDGGISSDKKEKLLKLKQLRDFEIQFYDMTKYDWSVFPERIFINSAAYYRLSIPEVLPKNVQKALYLDSDLIVEQDLKELWNIDISNHVLGAVEDTEGPSCCIRLNLTHKYFNSGVLLLNLSKLRKIDLLKDSMSYLGKNRKRIIYQDQDILNGLFNTQYKDLPVKWNVQSGVYYYFYADKKHSQLKPRELTALMNPAIVHFTLTNCYLKPWLRARSKHPLANEYWKYYKYTEFYSERE